MITQETLLAIVNRVQVNIESTNYVGYDPADALNSPFLRKISLGNKLLSRLLTHINTYSPLNFRKILRIEPASNTTALIVIASSLLDLYSISGKERYLVKAQIILKRLVEYSSTEYGGMGWGRSIDYQSNRTFHKKGVPLMFLTAKAGEVFAQAFELTNNEDYLHIAEESCECILKSSSILDNEVGICLSYTPKGSERILNVSAIAASLFATVGTYTDNKTYKHTANELLLYVISRQNRDGSWFYEYDAKNKPKKKQMDFHQGFVLDSLIDYHKLEEPNESLSSAILKGARFYKERQFLPDGRGKWRYPLLYPIDIHDQAQGIITFSKMGHFDSNYLKFAESIVQWTLDNMYDKDSGCFYFQNWRFFNNKICYLRWNQAWMLKALSTLWAFKAKRRLL